MRVSPSTVVEHDPEADTYRQLVAPHLLDLKGWRAHGLGMAQKYIGDGLRLHVWEPSLSTCKDDETTHSHRCDLMSRVLYGEIPHEEVTVKPGSEWQKVSFTTHDEGVDVAIVGHVDKTDSFPIVVGSGQLYLFPAGAYHRAWTVTCAITLLHTGPKVGPSYALFPKGREPHHSQSTITDREVARVLQQVEWIAKSWMDL